MYNISKQTQDELNKLQNLIEQIKIIKSQIFSIETSIKERELAIKELEGLEDDVTIYKQIGGVLIKTNKSQAMEDLKDEKTTQEMRLKTLKRSEESLEKKSKELEQKVKDSYNRNH
ncbi:MAG: prefoldin subunit beta [Promethearchaeota archaeon]